MLLVVEGFLYSSHVISEGRRDLQEDKPKALLDRLLISEDQVAQYWHQLNQMAFLEATTCDRGVTHVGVPLSLICLWCGRHLRIWVTIEVPQLVKDEHYLSDTAFCHALRANLLLILDELLECLFATIDEDRRGNLRDLQLNLHDVVLHLCLAILSAAVSLGISSSYLGC